MVSSNQIARVIGRAGGNINAIREATGAYIEVEKQNNKREQIDRQITLKGSETALRFILTELGILQNSRCIFSLFYVRSLQQLDKAFGSGENFSPNSANARIITVIIASKK